MNTHPPLTISLLTQISDRELQFNYLNHVDRTDEVAGLLAQIEDKDLALRIINLALEVDILLGSRLTGSAPLDVRAIIVEQIDHLEIPVLLKIDLWRTTKSKAALAYLQDIFVFKNRYRQMSIDFFDYERSSIIYHAIGAIIDLDQNLAAALMIESLYDNRFRNIAADRLAGLSMTDDADGMILAELMTPEATEALGDVLSYGLCDDTRRHIINILSKIGTAAAVAKIRDGLNKDKSRWLDLGWIQGLGVVADTPMVEHLVYLLHFGDEYIDTTSDEHIREDYREEHYRRKANELICEAILGIERLNGDLAFEVLHQSLYWIADTSFSDPSEVIIQALFRLDRDRTFAVLECAIHSYDPAVQMVAVQSLDNDTLIDDRTLSILLGALEDQEPVVQTKIVNTIESIIYRVQNPENPRAQIFGHIINISPELSALAASNPTIILHNSLNDLAAKDITNRVVQKELIKCRNLDFIQLLNVKQLDILLSDTELTEAPLDYYHANLRIKILTQMAKISNSLVLPKLISFLEDSEDSVRDAAIKGIVTLGSIETIPIFSLIAHQPELVARLIWHLEKLKDKDKTAPVFDLFLKDREWTNNFLRIAEKTLISIDPEDLECNIVPILCLGAIGISDEAVLMIDGIIRNGYHHYPDALEALANIDNELAMYKLLDYLFENINTGHACGFIEPRCKLGIIPQLKKCGPHCTEGLSSMISAIQEREGLYNPDFSDTPSYPMFQKSPPRLRDLLLGNIEHF
jgi:HEAT repeat protein